MNLESSQVYGGTPYTNPPDHPSERKTDNLCEICQAKEAVIEINDKFLCQSCYEDYMEYCAMTAELESEDFDNPAK